MNPISIRLLATLVSVATLLVGGTALAGDTTDVPAHEGPYVYWHDSTSATVFYYCQGEIVERKFDDIDTLRFHRFCQDEPVDHTVVAQLPDIAQSVYTDVPRIFAVSDIHGEYEALVDFLQTAGIIDADLHWSWSDGHLVFNGDIPDRGDMVTEIFWLIHRLEQEAAQVGGRVHYVFGNHDEMVMHGDNRYVNDKYLQGVARRSRIRHEELYGPAMELGRWLRSKPAMLRLNDVLFVHGGVSPELVERGMTIDDVNQFMREALYMNSSQVRFSDEPKFLLSSYGPLWYRGMVTEIEDRYERLTADEVAAIADYFGVSSIIVGHSETDQVEQHYDGLVYSIDIPLDELGTFQGLFWEAGKFYRVTGAGERESLD